MAPLPYTRATMATLCLAPISGSVDPMDAGGEGESLPAVSGIVCVCVMLYLLSTTSEFMAVNLRGRGRSPEAKDGLRCHKFLCSGQ